MEANALALAGCWHLRPRIFRDHRGTFIKTFHGPTLAPWGAALELREEFFTTSTTGVLRGMHFQAPPSAHNKLVTCLGGEVLDVLLDLRRSSPTYGRHAAITLRGETADMVFAPVGVAHGFLVLRGEALLSYKTDAVHDPQRDLGLRWDSFGFAWPVSAPILSARDAAFPALADFLSPFP